ncbi:MAG TPA: flagellar basal-body rod protein FlgF [Steroidobacteraceae bacterium]|jgi:flagellar hook protein FlgE
MLGTIYVSLSGMKSYSKGLDLISNNVANLNTAGFKAGEAVFSDMLYRNGGGAVDGAGGAPSGGAGVTVDTTRESFSEGELRQTGNPLDVAVDGDGFFVIQRGEGQVFTRAGQFELDQDGNLIEHTTQDKVLVSTDSAAATTFNINSYQVSPAKATTEVDVGGSLGRTGTSTYALSNIDVIDPSGAQQVLSANFTRDAANPLLWNVDVSNADGTVQGSGSIQFADDGTPASGSSQFDVTVSPTGVSPFALTFKFGDPGTTAGVTSLSSSTSSQLAVLKQDGVALGTLTGTSFDDLGRVTLKYSNGQTATPATLLLARFQAPTELVSLGSSLFAAADQVQPDIAVAQSGGRGTIVGGSLEMSNVDLTQQFTDLIVLQRGYQASSQLTSVANEMLEQLLTIGDHK